MTKKAASLHAYGCGVWRTMHHTLGDGTVVSWHERWLVTHSLLRSQWETVGASGCAPTLLLPTRGSDQVVSTSVPD